MQSPTITEKPRAICRQEDGRIWLRFAQRPSSEVRDAMKYAGYQFSARRGAWFTYAH